MSSLKDIMDVDVEPLESQAYRRSREAAQQQPQPNVPHPQSTQSSPSLPREQQATTVKRRRSNRVSKPGSSQGAVSRPSLARRRSSSGVDSMEAHGYGPSSSTQQAGPSNTMRQPPRFMDSSESQIRYTPVTGRISRAKKGQPVHICNLCEEPRVFSRAEHLRRHQLSHQQPQYPCTFQDCEKAFHRPDLLARHMHRHESQGEKPYKASEAARSRSPSTSTESHTPPLKVEAPRLAINTAGQTSPSGPVTPHTSARTDSARTAAYEPIMTSFQAVNFATTSNERSTSQSNIGSSVPPQAGSGAPPGSSMNTSSLAAPFNPDLSFNSGTGEGFENISHATPFEAAYQGDMSQVFGTPGVDRQQRLTLQVPDQAGPPSLTYANSPWCSSDSAWSTPSDVSRRGSAWPLDPLVPGATGLWDQAITVSPQLTHPPLRGLRSPGGLGIVPEGFESPPYASPHLSPPMVSYQMEGVPGLVGGYQATELVGNPTFSRSFKAVAQSFSAISTSRIPPTSRSFLGGTRRSLVDVEDHSLFQPPAVPALSTEQLASCVASYRRHIEPLFPILHPAAYDQSVGGLVFNAVLALGTQFQNDTDNRRIGSHLSQTCNSIMMMQSGDWSIEMMQSTLLMELFDIIRCPKIESRSPSRFSRLFKYLLQTSWSDRDDVCGRLDSHNINTYIELRLSSYKIDDPARHRVLEDIWRQWIDFEIRQRLRSACLILDVHRSLYYGQPRSAPSVNFKTTFLTFPCPDSLWVALNAQQWYESLLQAGYSSIQLTQPKMPPEQVTLLSPAGQSLVLSSLAALLSSEGHSDSMESTSYIINSIYTSFPDSITSQAYLALYFTPVHDLLASTGETWLFGRKITSQPEMIAARERTLRWSRTSTAAQATWHACHVLRLFLGRSLSQSGFPDASGEPAISGLCDFWAAYMAAIICWAFGRVAPPSTFASIPVIQHHRSPSAPSSTSSVPVGLSTSAPKATATSSATMSRRSSWNFSNSTGSHNTDDTASVRSAALAYCDAMIAHAGQLRDTLLNVSMRGETGMLLEAVRWQLGVFAVSEGQGQCAMLLDACRVLERLKMSK